MSEEKKPTIADLLGTPRSSLRKKYKEICKKCGLAYPIYECKCAMCINNPKSNICVDCHSTQRSENARPELVVTERKCIDSEKEAEVEGVFAAPSGKFTIYNDETRLVCCLNGVCESREKARRHIRKEHDGDFEHYSIEEE